MAESKKNKDCESLRAIRSLNALKLKKKANITRTHVVMDIYKCDEKSLAKASMLEKKILKVLREMGFEPKIQTFYQFEPFGVTATVFAEGLHFTFHTWPEHKSGAIDLYCFKERKIGLEVINRLKEIFKFSEYDMKVRKR